MEELEEEIEVLKKECAAATAKCKHVSIALEQHDDRANVLQFKLQGDYFGSTLTGETLTLSPEKKFLN